MRKSMVVLLASVLSLALPACMPRPSHRLPGQAPLHEIVKTQADQREYCCLTLENELKVLLISDAETDKSAAAMVVSVGAYHAPRDREGLLHFLEHMLFLGTEKYPVAGEYVEFLRKNAGNSSANTGSEKTDYFFEVKNDALEEALDRFAQFFIAPTMDPTFVELERNSVDSEFRLKIKDEFRRTHEACRRAMNPEHPHSMFSTGNMETLADRDGDAVYEDLLEAYRRHYSANRMSLAVLGRQPLADLEEMVVERFGTIKNNGLERPTLPTDFLAAEQLGTRVHIVPLREERSVELTFPIDDPWQYRLRKPTEIITHLLGHKGDHSLYQRLDHRGLIESLSAYVSDSEAFDALSIHMKLTSNGLLQVDQIIHEIFEYIDLIAREGVAKAYYEEIRAIAALDFEYREDPGPMETVTRLAPMLRSTEPEHLLIIDHVYHGFDADLTRRFLRQLTPFNMQMVLIAPGLSTDRKEPRYDVDYAIHRIPAAKLEWWASAEAADDMRLPGLNPLVVRDTRLRTSPDGTKPELVLDRDGLELWHYQDTSFETPKSSCFVRVGSPVAACSESNRAMLALTRRLVEDRLSSFGYHATKAGLSYAIFDSDRGLGFSVEGYSEKQSEFIEEIIRVITDVEIDPDRFVLMKDGLIREWRNSAIDRPIGQVYSRMLQEFGVDPFSRLDLAEALEPISLEQLNDYVSAMLSEVDLKVLVHGNTDSDEAIALGTRLREAFPRSDRSAPHDAAVLRQLGPGEQIIAELEIDHDDSAIVITYPAEVSFAGLQKTRMLGQVLAAPFLDDLRTTQQLGYTVGVFGGEVANIPALIFYIQSSVAGPGELERRIDRFIADHVRVVEQMSDEEFMEYRTALLVDINQQDGNLAHRSSRLWHELENGYIDFDKRERMTTAVSEMTKQDLVDAYRDMLLSDDRRRLISRNRGRAHPERDSTSASR